MTVDDYPDVLRFESQLADRLGDHRTGFGRARVEQDMPLRSGEQPGAQSLRANEIQWADDLHRLGGLVPFERFVRHCHEELVVIGKLLLGWSILR